MFGLFRRLFSPGRDSTVDPKKEAEAKAWLDDLRRNELSVNARRQIAPDEPVKAPGMAFGSAVPVAVPYKPATREETQQPMTPQAGIEADYVPGELGAAETSACDASGSDNLSCGSDSD